MSEKDWDLGDVIEVYCPSCRLNLDANVAALYEGDVKQVQCRTCGNFVKYRPPSDMKKKKERQLRQLMRMKGKKNGEVAEEAKEAAQDEQGESVAIERWKALTDDVDSRYARPYDRHRTYEEGTILLHKAHGMGHIEHASDVEIIVLFKEGLIKLSQSELRDE